MTKWIALAELRQLCLVPLEVAPVDIILKMIHTV